ncbi:GNAT family N-acetyltransferase [Pararhodobacter aggregans]|uniref:N-acetyltransferase n=1 Tax=Pararhodobacter aggregans TaxID=404875 RepID=A0A2T7UMB9_9RHOB|nr:GNAT family N-acetyltransferase [Pararhodobacter aggregans]PTW99126.1 acetyltransferase (GNAT) family protein [Pararhodobacter aggregans]PVE45850.1 N-acetyltransferase [Pararhodobacter aggregans]
MPDALCHALARALIGDPFYRAVTDRAGDEGARLDLLARYLDASRTEARVIGMVEEEGAQAGAFWHLPGIAAEVADAATKAKKAAFLGSIGAEGLAAYETLCAAMAAQTPRALTSAWYLSILGTDPAAQGQGLASRLLSRTLTRADAARAVSYLETFNRASLPFYARHGFTEAKALDDPGTGQPYWLLVRPAR